MAKAFRTFMGLCIWYFIVKNWFKRFSRKWMKNKYEDELFTQYVGHNGQGPSGYKLWFNQITLQLFQFWGNVLICICLFGCCWQTTVVILKKFVFETLNHYHRKTIRRPSRPADTFEIIKWVNLIPTVVIESNVGFIENSRLD